MSDEPFTVKESRFKGDNGDVELFQWLRQLDAALEKQPKAVVRLQFGTLERFLVKIAVGSDDLPSPSRPIRQALSRSLVQLYSRSESRTLYDTLQVLLKSASEQAQSRQGDKDARICPLFCLGELMLAFGSQVMSVVADLVIAALKLFRSTANSVLLRYHAAVTIFKCIRATAKAIPESTVKDLVKTFKQSIGDKAPSLQRISLEILAMIPKQLGQTSIQEVDNIVTLGFRYVDSTDHKTRRHFAQVIGTLLSTFLITSLANNETSVNADRKGPDEDSESTLPEVPKAPTPSVTLQLILSQLSAGFNRSSSTHRTRVAIVQTYATLMDSLGAAYVEANYPTLANHFLVDIIAHPRNRTTVHEILRTRKFVGVLLRDLIGVRMLTEQGQIAAIQDLVASYLRKWPALMPGQNAPHDLTLVVALKEVAELLQQLGNAPQFLQTALIGPVTRLLEHPDRSVRVAASYCVQQFCCVVPRRLQQTAENLATQLNKEIAALLVPGTHKESQSKALGQAAGLAALFALFPHRHLYVSYDICSNVLDMAIQLLKRTGEHDLALAAVEAEISWNLISALVTLGRHFVYPHLSQLLTLWRNTLSRASAKDGEDNPPRFSQEMAFLLHVRHCALGALQQFLHHNYGLLVTLDVARRVSAALSHALSFANTLTIDQYDEDAEPRIPLPHLNATVSDLEVMFKRRMFQCFLSFGTAHITDTSQTAVIDAASKVFSGLDTYRGSQVQAAIAASTGSFTSIWECNDGYAYGVSTLDWWTGSADTALPAVGNAGRIGRNQDSVEWAIIIQLEQPILGSCECDPLSLLTSAVQEGRSWPEPPPVATGMVDAAINVFTAFIGYQPVTLCDRGWSTLLNNVRSPRLERNPGRKAAVTMNTTGALLEYLRWADREGSGPSISPALHLPLIDFLKGNLTSVDYKLRKVASDAYGLMTARLDGAVLTSQVKTLVDQVLSNRDPSSRAGCALALGSLYTSVGGLAGGPLLKTIVNVLMSLGNDPHVLVHYYALQALATVIDAAGLSYETHIRSTLGMLAKLYMSEAHEPEGRRYMISAGLSDLPMYAVMCEIADSMVAVLGPELRDSSRLRTLLLALVQELSIEDDEAVVVEAMRCLQHCLMFARDSMDVPAIVLRLRKYLASPRTPLKSSAVNGLYLLVQKDVLLVSKYGGDQLAEALFAMLDADASVEGVRAILSSWLSQTVTANPSAWINLCQKIMSQANNSQQALKPEAPSSLPQDDESQSLQITGESQNGTGLERHTIGRWRTQLFALQCLHDICKTLSSTGSREHLDLRFAKMHGLNLSNLLASKVSDLIRMAFTASTAYVTEIRLAGLVVLRDVVEIFADALDPDVEGTLLLEQYQAPIAAALTPAFSADSTPELLASAVEVCATFVGSGVVEDGSKMGRILKLLTTALVQCDGTQNLTLGEGGQLGPNASVMLRISVISAWAKLAMLSRQRAYLEAVIRPHRSSLASLWVENIADYARLKAHSEMTTESDDSGIAGLSSTILEKDVTLQYYADSWWYIIAAVSLFMEQDDSNLSAPLNGLKQTNGLVTNGKDHAHELAPCMLYPVLLGLSCQILLEDPPSGSPASLLSEQRTLTFRFLSQLLRPRFSGDQPLHLSTFTEISAMLYRFALGGAIGILEGVLCATEALAHRSTGSDAGWELSEDAAHCVRIALCILRRLSSEGGLTSGANGSTLDFGGTYCRAVEALCHITGRCSVEVHENARDIALTTFVEMLREEKSNIGSIAPFLPALKVLLTWPSHRPQMDAYTRTQRCSQAVHGLLSACIMNIEAMSGRQGPEVTTKVQNNLLTAAVALSVCPPTATFSYAAVEQYCSLLVQHLTGVAKELSRNAQQCAHILLSAARAGPPVLQLCCRLLLPGLVSFSMDLARTDQEDQHRLLDSFLGVADAEQVTHILCVLLPIYVANLQGSPTTTAHKVGVTQILALASAHPNAFREATACLHLSTRDKMEIALRQAVAPSVPSSAQPAKRQIALRQF